MATSEIHWTKEEESKWKVGLFIGSSMLYASRFTMALTMPQVSSKMKWSKTQSGTVLSSFFWGYTLTQVIGGYLSDVLGGDLVIVCTALGWILFTILTPFITWFFETHYVVFVLMVYFRIIIGAFQGLHFPAMASMSSHYLSEGAAFFSFVSTGKSMGVIVCGCIGSILLDYYGWESVFFVIGIMAIFWVFYVLIFLIQNQRRKSVLVSLSANLVQIQVPQPLESVPWHLYLESPEFWSMLAAHVSSAHCWHQLVSWFPTYFYDNFRGSQSWVVHVLPWSTCLLGVWIGQVLDECMRKHDYRVESIRKTMELLSQGIPALCLFILGYVHSYPTTVFLMSVAVGANGLHHSGALVNSQDIAPKHSHAIFSIINMAGAISGFVGVYLAGFIVAATHSWSSVFNLTALVNVIGAGLFVLFGSGDPIYE